jgi:hypothetical protein
LRHNITRDGASRLTEPTSELSALQWPILRRHSFLPFPGSEAETTQPESSLYLSFFLHFAGIREGPPARAEAVPSDPYVLPVVEEAASTEGIVTAPAVPEPGASDVSISEQPKSVNAPVTGLMPKPVRVQTYVPVLAAALLRIRWWITLVSFLRADFPKDDISTPMRKAQAATLADSEPTIVEDPSTTDPIPTDAAPATHLAYPF